jgi:hypothetical protein
MHCLENLYKVSFIYLHLSIYCYLFKKKISGHPLQYTAIVGKPSEITYYHAEYLISRHAYDLGYKQPIKRIYAVGVSLLLI